MDVLFEWLLSIPGERPTSNIERRHASASDMAAVARASRPSFFPTSTLGVERSMFDVHVLENASMRSASPRASLPIDLFEFRISLARFAQDAKIAKDRRIPGLVSQKVLTPRIAVSSSIWSSRS